VADQATAVLLLPVTVAVNCWVLPVSSHAEVGEMDTETTGAVTATVAEAELVLSAALVAVTVYVPAVLGAVYRPLVETVPPVVDQLILVLLGPVTVAVNCWVLPVSSDAELGEMDTETGTVTVTVAEADLVASATLAAFTL
jgi:hypothetical protein